MTGSELIHASNAHRVVLAELLPSPKVYKKKPSVSVSHLTHDSDHGAREEHYDTALAVELEVPVVDVDVFEDEELGDVFDEMRHQSLRLLGAIKEELLTWGDNLAAVRVASARQQVQVRCRLGGPLGL